MREITCRLLIIGSGPGGYVCALRAGQLGIDTVLVEEARLGGTCLTVGCIPSKALIHAADEFHRTRHPGPGVRITGASFDLPEAMAWKDGIVDQLSSGVGTLLRKAKVRLIHGRADLRDGKTAVVAGDDPVTIRCETLVIATGSEPATLPALPFGGDILSSTEALALTEVPARLAVVGGGYIGLELGMAYAKLGSTVTVVETAPRILPAWDADLTTPLMSALDRLGVRVLTGSLAQGFSGGALSVLKDGAEDRVGADKVLVTVGRRPRSTAAGIAGLGLATDGPFLRIDGACRTSMTGVYAIGDVTGEPMLAHRAMAQGEMVAELVAGHARTWDHRAMPAVCFTDPEIVSVGLLPDQAAARGPVKVASFPFGVNGRALTENRFEGFVRVVADGDGREILGIQAVGSGVSELAGEFSLALEMGATLADIAATIHAHPTRGEVLHEASLRALGRTLHL
ncbi:dihydrolipoyl dehydrogenase [Frigidibacter albus]|uniref:Dihydrolipoyl dehydrogenase n=1 Tax=Frigidibacter albus TaxID=1465486 RepID=A0A6L8VIZ2_9RHOB|nr:dihydrolipoyl dehydrogenase [Frigidibacter albus]MZQ89279.1 dihydrolipoyl dehydrogenase [Frigidibacter albus]NBE31185.1 dihydrolipoyl dehydrogenase [Frigidibacter albus]GGH53358.1 dihydrolipoyl dehydrogenase [Frigidibacter albus]